MIKMKQHLYNNSMQLIKKTNLIKFKAHNVKNYKQFINYRINIYLSKKKETLILDNLKLAKLVIKITTIVLIFLNLNHFTSHHTY